MARNQRSALPQALRLVAAMVGAPLPCAAQGGSTDHNPVARDAMIRTLGATNPHPSLGDEARTFDRLVGTWDCDYTFYLEDGRVRRKSGELSFGWILDGRAIQDVWITYPADGQKERSISASVRFFDTALKQWRVFFVSPRFNYAVQVQGGLEGDHIVLRGTDADGYQIRWSFNEIGTDSFIWRGEKSRDGGKTWKLEEEHHMKRRLGEPG